MSERDRTHSFSMRCATHGEVRRIPCACSRDHGSTDVECGYWCPKYEAHIPDEQDLLWARRSTRTEEMWG